MLVTETVETPSVDGIRCEKNASELLKHLAVMQLATAMLTTEFVPTCVTEKQNRMHRNIISSECTTTAMESGDLPIETTAGVADQLRSGFGLIQTAFQLHRKSAVEEINDLKSKYENLKIHVSSSLVFNAGCTSAEEALRIRSCIRNPDSAAQPSEGRT